MKTNYQLFLLLSLFAFSVGCSEGYKSPKADKTEVKGAKVTPPIQIDPCEEIENSTCVEITANDSLSYNICYILYNSSATETIVLSDAQVKFPVHGSSSFEPNVCPGKFKPISIPPDGTVIIADSYCMDSSYHFVPGEPITFLLTIDTVVDTVIMPVCQL